MAGCGERCAFSTSVQTLQFICYETAICAEATTIIWHNMGRLGAYSGEIGACKEIWLWGLAVIRIGWKLPNAKYAGSKVATWVRGPCLWAGKHSHCKRHHRNVKSSRPVNSAIHFHSKPYICTIYPRQTVPATILKLNPTNIPQPL